MKELYFIILSSYSSSTRMPIELTPEEVKLMKDIERYTEDTLVGLVIKKATKAEKAKVW